MGTKAPVWGKDRDQAWRRTFTRENKLGERKLAFDLRHKTPGEVVRAMKARDRSKEASDDAETKRLAREVAKSSVLRPEMPKLDSGDEIQMQNVRADFKWPYFSKLFCFIGIHKWDGQHRKNAYEHRYYKICERCRIFGPEV